MSSETPTFYLGASGWSHRDWVGHLYPHDLAPDAYLATYAQHFTTVEIAHTFFAAPTRHTVQAWYRRTPAAFVLSPCLPRDITHRQRLRQAHGLVEAFLAVIRELGEKLGPILIQLPEDFRSTEEEYLEAFLRTLPPEMRYAVEFRHGSWHKDSTLQLLERYQVAWVIVDAPFMPRLPHVTADFAYVRWHSRPGHRVRRQLDPVAALRPWVPVLHSLRRQVTRVYGYVHNQFSGYAPRDCHTLLQLLGQDAPGPHQT